MIISYLTLGLIIPTLIIQLITIAKSSIGRSALVGSLMLILLAALIYGVIVYFNRVGGHTTLVIALLSFAGLLLLGACVMNMSLLCSITSGGYHVLVSSIILLFALFVMTCVNIILLIRNCPDLKQAPAFGGLMQRVQEQPGPAIGQKYVVQQQQAPAPGMGIQQQYGMQQRQAPAMGMQQRQAPAMGMQRPQTMGMQRPLRNESLGMSQITLGDQQGISRGMVKRTIPLMSTNATSP